MPPKLLIIDDDLAVLDVLKHTFEDQDYQITLASDGKKGLALAHEEIPNVAIVDIKLPGISGLEVLKLIKKIDSRISVIITTGYNTTQNAIEAMKNGAFDYIIKPFDILTVQKTVENGLAANLLNRKVKFTGQKTEIFTSPPDEDIMIGTSPEMLEIWKKVGKVADSDATVLIEGESGTGKELLARAIYNNSGRKNKPFLAVNCAAMPENLLESDLFGHERGAFTDAHARRIGKFEQCDGGTLFLDEIAEMSLTNQSKLLRVLEDQSFFRVGGNTEIHADVRIIAATNHNLLKEVSRKRFRLDLIYRLRVASFELPPLRERQQDLPLLIELFTRQYAAKYGKNSLRLAPETITFLSTLPWEGNIRELKNAISAAIVFSRGDILLPQDFGHLQSNESTDLGHAEISTIGLRDAINGTFPEMCRTHPGEVYQLFSQEMEHILVELAIKYCKNNQVAAAKLLGISRNTLRKRIERGGKADGQE